MSDLKGIELLKSEDYTEISIPDHYDLDRLFQKTIKIDDIDRKFWLLASIYGEGLIFRVLYSDSFCTTNIDMWSFGLEDISYKDLMEVQYRATHLFINLEGFE